MLHKLLIVALLSWSALSLELCQDHRDNPDIPAFNQPYKIGDILGEWTLIGFQDQGTDELNLATLRKPVRERAVKVGSSGAATGSLLTDYEIIYSEGPTHVYQFQSVPDFFRRRDETVTDWTSHKFLYYYFLPSRVSDVVEPGFRDLIERSSAYRINTIRGVHYLRLRAVSADGLSTRAAVLRRAP